MRRTCQNLRALQVKRRTDPEGLVFYSSPLLSSSFLLFVGVLSIYWGVSASVMRQLIYSGARFAMFNKISGEMDRRKMKRSFVKDLALATVSGVFGGFLGTPFDIVNVRMQNDAKLPPAMKRKLVFIQPVVLLDADHSHFSYKHVFDGMYRILRAEGVRTLFKGATLVMGRSIGITIGQIPIYGSVKNFLKSTGYFGEDKKTHFVASSIGVSPRPFISSS